MTHPPAHLRIGTDNGGSLESSKVERLGRGPECKRSVPKLFGQAGKRDMSRCWHLQVGMNFVAGDENPVPQAYFAHRAKLLRRPGPAGRIVWITQQKQLYARIGDFAFQVFKVHFVGEITLVVFANRYTAERIFKHIATLIADGREKTVVGRRLDDYLVAWRAKGTNDGGQRRDNADRIYNRVRRNLPAMANIEPADKTFVPRARWQGIAEHALLHATAQGIDDGGGGAEVHVRNPERQNAVLGGQIPLLAVRPTAGNKCVKVVVHCILYRTIAHEWQLRREESLADVAVATVGKERDNVAAQSGVDGLQIMLRTTGRRRWCA